MSGITILSIAGILLALSNIVQSRAIAKIKECLRSQQKLIEAWQERNEILSDILLMMGKEMAGKELKDLKQK